MKKELYPEFQNWNDEWEKFKQVLEKAIDDEVSYDAICTIRTGWRENKKDLLPHFREDGRLFIEVDKSEEPLTSEDLDAAVYIMRKAGEKLRESKFAELKKGKDIVTLVSRFCLLHATKEEVASNKLEKKVTIGGRTFSPGTKLSKYLKEFLVVNYIEPEDGLLYSDRDKKDKIIEFANILLSIATEALRNREDIVCLSINPIDIFLQSTHTTGWRSCHATDGEYKAGLLSLIMDEVTAIAYVYRTIEPFYNLDLPRKIWRQLVYFDLENGSCLHSREYSGSNPTFAKYARKLSAKVLTEHKGVEYRWKAMPLNGNFKCSSKDEEDDDSWSYILETRSSWHYQDDPTYRVRLPEGKRPEVHIGSYDIPCLKCGYTREDDNSRSFYCDYCEGNYYYCSSCDEQLTEEDIYEGLEDEILCGDCFHERYFYCARCDGLTRRDDAIFTVDGPRCPDCVERYYFDCDYCEDLVLKNDLYEVHAQDGEERYYCSECVSCYAIECAWCGELWIDFKEYKGKYYCIECYEAEIFKEEGA